MKTKAKFAKKNPGRIILSCILAIGLVVSMMPLSLTKAYAQEVGQAVAALAGNTTEFGGGAGTPDNPYLISSKQHLDNVRKYLNASFKLMADITFTEADFSSTGSFYNNGEG